MNELVTVANDAAARWAAMMWPVAWQSAILAGVVFLVTRLLRRGPAALRFWLWMLVPLKLLIMPVLTVTIPLLPAESADRSGEFQLMADAAVTRRAEQPVAVEGALGTGSMGSTEAARSPAPPEEKEARLPNGASGDVEGSGKKVRPSIWALLMAAWTAGVGYFSVKLGRGWCRMRRVVADARETEGLHSLKAAAEAARAIGLKRVPKTLVTDEAVSPFVYGVVQPVVVLPAKLVRRISSEELVAVLAHEFAHLRRRDLVVGWVLAVCEAICFFHPALHLAKRRIMFERERACDELVLGSGRARRGVYAEALITAAAVHGALGGRTSPLPVVAESFRHLRRRLIMMSSEAGVMRRLSRGAAALLAILAVLSIPGLALTARETSAGSARESESAEGVADESLVGEHAELDELDPEFLNQLRNAGMTDDEIVAMLEEVGEGRGEEGAETRGKIAGVVVNANTGKPIKGAYVAIDRSGDAGGSNLERFRQQGIYATAETDEEGRFVLKGVAFMDDHPFMVTCPGFVRHDQTIALAKGADVDLTVKLKPAGAISVTLVDAEGKPMEEPALVRLEANDGRLFRPLTGDWPMLAYWMEFTETGDFSFGQLEPGVFTIEAMRFEMDESRKLIPPWSAYHGRIAEVELGLEEKKEVELKAEEHDTSLKLKIEKDPEQDPERTSVRPAQIVAISRDQSLLVWADRRWLHPEDERLGRLMEGSMFHRSMSPGDDYTFENLPEGVYSVFVLSVRHSAVCVRGKKVEIGRGAEVVAEIPWEEPFLVGIADTRALDKRVTMELTDARVEGLCEMLTAITDSKINFIADPSIRDETLTLRANDVPIWEVLERVYLDKGWKAEWRVEEGKETLVLRPEAAIGTPLVAPEVTPAAEPGEVGAMDKRVTAGFYESPLERVLETLSAHVGAPGSLVAAPEIRDEKVTLRAFHMSLRELVEKLCAEKRWEAEWKVDEEGKETVTLKPKAAISSPLAEPERVSAPGEAGGTSRRVTVDPARRSANMSSAIATLHSLTAAQAEFRRAAEVDQDADGKGEYGFFQEMLGLAPARGRGVKLDPPYLPRSLGESMVGGSARKSGYLFKIYLPGDRGSALGEEDGKPLPVAKGDGVNMQELCFVCYAWPEKVGETGTRAFATTEEGEIYTTKMEKVKYDGIESVPAASALYKGKAFTSQIDGSDGNTWTPASG